MQVQEEHEENNIENTKIATSVLRCLVELEGGTFVRPTKKPEHPKCKRRNLGLQPLEIPTALATECDALGCISFRLPKSYAEAGHVLRHSTAVLESLFRQQEPLIFKIGVTHDPVWRWSNRLYGYCHDKDCWQGMVIFYLSMESAGPGMLEASLIDKYRCC